MNSLSISLQPITYRKSQSAQTKTGQLLSFTPVKSLPETGLTAVLATETNTHVIKLQPALHDRRLGDLLVIVVLSVFIHATVIEHFKHLPADAEKLLVPPKQPPMMKVSLIRPDPIKIEPPPPPLEPVKIEPPPPPPPPKLIQPPPKAPQPAPVKSAVAPKPIKPQQPQPAPVKTAIPQKPVKRVVETPPPIASSTPTANSISRSAPPAPPAPIQEKITEPRFGANYLRNPAPEYPEVAMERGWEGRVLLKVYVQPNGRPERVDVEKSSGRDMLDSAAVRTVKSWSFVPAMRGSSPIAGWVIVPITFKL